jgi:hypothetical protein
MSTTAHRIQALSGPKDVVFKSSPIIHGHIVPSFGRNDKAEATIIDDNIGFESNQVKERNNLDYTHSWGKDIPCLMRESPIAEAYEHVNLRIIVESNLDGPFPKSHRVMITCPLDDIFFHWTFLCSPFSFQTLVRKMGWEMGNDAGDPTDGLFDRFGYIVNNCASQCSRFPDRAKARLTLDHENEVAQLVFTEIVQNYRKIELLVLEFAPSE